MTDQMCGLVNVLVCTDISYNLFTLSTNDMMKRPGRYKNGFLSFDFENIIASQQAVNYCDVKGDDTNTRTGY